MTDAPKRTSMGNPLTGEIAEYLRADLIDMDVLRRVEAALDHCVVKEVEYMLTNKLGDPEKQHTVRHGRKALTDLRAMMEKLK